LKIVTLAPEIPAGLDAVRFLVQQGIQVSIGHSSANYQQAKAALVAGVRRGTHVFNTMPPIHHRAPGPVIALLEDATAFIELIVDGYHIAPPVVAMVLRLIGPDRGILITDGVDAAGQGDGVYTRWEGTKVIVSDGQVKTEKNVLAGSTLRMNEAVANLVRLVGVPLPAALRMASENPARAIGILDRKGTITPGKDADVVVLNDDFSVRYTIIQGEIAYEQSE
jgi:N-acetylglucosamine-6-phosphate deacetylase